MSRPGNAGPKGAGVVLACGGRFTPRERERLGESLGRALLVEECFGAAGQVAGLAARIARRRFRRVLLAGIAPAGNAPLLAELARRARLPAAAVAGLDLAPALAARGRAQAALRAIRKGLAALAEVPEVERRRLDLEPGVLVVGAGLAGREAAGALLALGHPVTVVEQDRAVEGPQGCALLSGSRVRRVEGQLGRFTVSVRTPSGDRQVSCGAVVLATGIPPAWEAAPGVLPPAAGSNTAPGGPAPPYDLPGVLPLEALEQAASRLPRRRGGSRVALVLDWNVEESKGSTRAALELALRLQQDCLQVHLLCREVRVAAMELEELYDRARQAGVDVARFEDRPAARAKAKDRGLEVEYRDAVLGRQVCLDCELAGVSGYGVRPQADPEVARLFGVSLDRLGQLQSDNIHLFPGQTNRPGIFAVGACRGQFDPQGIASDARATALAAHRLLSPGVLEVELDQPVVDEDKCALCLTCVRSCPHGAMYVDRARGAAACSPEACRRCGICVGECPARAITLPAWTDAAVLSQVG